MFDIFYKGHRLVAFVFLCSNDPRPDTPAHPRTPMSRT